MADEPKEERKRRKWPWIVAATLLALPIALYFALPTVICAVDWPEMTFDLSEELGENANLFKRRSLRVKPEVSRVGNVYTVRAAGRALDWPFSAAATVTTGWLSARGKAEVRLDGTPWHADVRFSAPSLREWKAELSVPETSFDERDGVLAPLLAQLTPEAVSNLTFKGTLRIDAKADRTPSRPVTAWNARAGLRLPEATLFAQGYPVEARDVRLNATASGVADHYDIDPLVPAVGSVEAAGFTLTNVHATVFSGKDSYLVTEATAGCCGGTVSAYSVYLNTKSLSSGFTLFMDGVDAGEALSHVAGFNGEATGRLYGKVQLFLRNGRELKLRDSYVYSVPGEGGSLRIDDATPVTDSLALGGVSAGECDNLAKALADLDYSVLKVDLRRTAEDDALALTLKLQGSATRGKTTVPVSFEVTFRGDLEQLINTGFKAMRK